MHSKRSLALICLGSVVLVVIVYYGRLMSASSRSVNELSYPIRGKAATENVSDDDKLANRGSGDEDVNSDEKRSCVMPQTSRLADIRIPLKRHETTSFLLPPPTGVPLTEGQLTNETIFTFIHVNKAGGTLFKEGIFAPAAKVKKWDGVGFGSAFGWRQLLKPCTKNGSSIAGLAGEALACGTTTALTPCGPSQGGSCPLRLIWGSHAMGLCQLKPEQPCVITIIFRHPLERIISQYNYVCVEGKEGRKKWTDEWRRLGRCPLTLLEFADTDLTSHTFLIDHLIRGADPHCGVDLALRNLRHPCVRFLLLDKLSDGLLRLANTWGPAIRPFIERIARSMEKKNQSPYSIRTRAQVEDPRVQEALRKRLKQDVEFYEKALEYYEEQWDQPLESCNAGL